MAPRGLVLLTALTLLVAGHHYQSVAGASTTALRDPLKQPFASTSIWNMPIGADASYTPANIPTATAGSLTVDPDILILEPDAPMTAVHQNDDGWSGGDRCSPGAYVYSVPIPPDFTIAGASPSSTPNNAAAILMPDGRTIRQPQPLTRCEAGGPATALVTYPDVDIYGDGVEGAHGGSGLSSIGGTVRLGEFVPGGAIRHALKINLQASVALSPTDGGFRWPATKADWCAPACYGGLTPELRMGALLALPPSVNIDSMGFRTEAARMLAWTLQNYGGYVVDDTNWSVYAITVEHSPDGQVEDEFQARWGFDIASPKHTPWGRDMDLLFGSLAVVDNNGPSSVGGGGAPRQPLAPPLDEPPSDGSDTDGDGCTDAKEQGPNPILGGQRDPENPYDFYDVPAPALRLGYFGQTPDRGIGATTDVVALLKYAGLTSWDPDYIVDNDRNGVQDGLQYDRSLSALPRELWRSGPPDGGVGVTTDIVAMLAQSGHFCAGPP